MKKSALSMHICFQKEKTKINIYVQKSALDSMFLGVIRKKKKERVSFDRRDFSL